jgi:membrane-associated HD superfamily phosphohydrolase
MRNLLVLIFLILAVPTWAQSAPDNPSLGVSSGGQMVTGALPFDPSKNVLQLVEAAIKRQDDLRAALQESTDARLKLVAELSALRSQHDRELLQANTERLEAEARLRAEFDKLIRDTEKARVDAIRQVDKAAVDQTSSAAIQTAAGLAKTVTESAAVLSTQNTTTADALRSLVASTATETNRNIQNQFTTLGQTVTAIGTRVQSLEQGSAQGVGERKFSDPAVAAIAEQVRVLVRQQADSAGVGAGSSATWAIMIAIGGLALLAIGVIFTFISLSRKVKQNGVPQGG